jgi:hypothetical protein
LSNTLRPSRRRLPRSRYAKPKPASSAVKSIPAASASAPRPELVKATAASAPPAKVPSTGGLAEKPPFCWQARDRVSLLGRETDDDCPARSSCHDELRESQTASRSRSLDARRIVLLAYACGFRTLCLLTEPCGKKSPGLRRLHAGQVARTSGRGV